MKYEIKVQDLGCRHSGFSIIRYAVYRKRWPWSKWKLVEDFKEEGQAIDFIYCLKNKLPYSPV